MAAGILLSACLLGAWMYLGQSGGHYVLVSVDGTEYGRYSLDEDQEIQINKTNRLVIQDGQASMAYADCPDQICVHMVPISRIHEMIVCMPNKVTVEVFEE